MKDSRTKYVFGGVSFLKWDMSPCAICLIGTVFEGSLLCVLQRLDFERPSRGSDHSGHIGVEVQTVLLRVVGSLLGNRGVSLPYVGNQG